jgi:hypothetical protein
VASLKQGSFDELEVRLRSILPAEYQGNYEAVQPVSMGSAGLKFGPDGNVAWDQMWGSFCDLAMAGGPPHKGKLLEPGSRNDIEDQPEKYRKVTSEICRGIYTVTGLGAEPSTVPGWVRVDCESSGMAAWLYRAVVMENVSARFEDTAIALPAGPHYRIEKEIKNVITSIAKTSHYWLDHMSTSQQQTIGNIFARLENESPLVHPAFGHAGTEALRGRMGGAIEKSTGLKLSGRAYDGWLGIECPSVKAAIWMMRTLAAINVLARREETILFVPVNPESDPTGNALAQAVVKVHEFAVDRGAFTPTQG